MDTNKLEHRTYYDLLGVKRSASVDEIKRAYHKLARKFHPDVKTEEIEDFVPGDLTKTRKFKILTFAYHTLTSPKLREEYDKSLPPEWDYGENDADAAADELFSPGQLYQKSRTNAFGVFGSVNAEYAEEPEETPEEAQARMADLIKEPPSFWKRIFSWPKRK